MSRPSTRPARDRRAGGGSLSSLRGDSRRPETQAGERSAAPRRGKPRRDGGPSASPRDGRKPNRQAGPRRHAGGGPRHHAEAGAPADAATAAQNRLRTPLAQRGGAITTQGDPAFSAELEAALVAAESDEINDLTHGFHTYPARMHPRLARELVARFSSAGDIVLDPFCGSGTVLVEALVAGRRPQGIDLNPLALRITEVHCALRNLGSRRHFERLLAHVATASEERVRTRARAHISIERETQAFYQPHVLFELCGLREEIESVPDETERRALLIVFSSLLIKFSRKRADTSAESVDKRIRKGLVTEFFVRKGHELCMRWEALFDAAPSDAFEARLMCGDARELKHLLGAPFRADLIATSPPYGGTYDYARQHALRNDWFGFDTERLQEREIGARRTVSQARGGEARWNEELLAALRAMREVSSDDARIVLWLGDAEVAGVRIPADEQVAQLAPDAALALLASASQPRQDAHGGRDRMERLLLLEPVPYRNKRS